MGVKGGLRVGAGRKLGSQNKRTIARVSHAELFRNDGGVVPLGVMIHNMRAAFAAAERADREIKANAIEGMDPEEAFETLLAMVNKAIDLRDIAQKYAVDAAPYVHPRLSAVAFKPPQSADQLSDDATLINGSANTAPPGPSPLMLELAAWDEAEKAFEYKSPRLAAVRTDKKLAEG
jgi:hypothetical protein